MIKIYLTIKNRDVCVDTEIWIRKKHVEYFAHQFSWGMSHMYSNKPEINVFSPSEDTSYSLNSNNWKFVRVYFQNLREFHEKIKGYLV